MKRKLIASGYEYEDTFGYSRAVRVGRSVYMSGTTARGEDLRGDAYMQAEAILKIVAGALKEAGATMKDVVRTVTYVTDVDADEGGVARAHREAFGKVRPASTLVGVSRLLDPKARVEIEVTARIADD